MGSWVEVDGRNRKASKIVLTIRAVPEGTRPLRASEIERMSPEDRAALCARAGVRVASVKTWAEVVTIMRALEARERRPAAPVGMIVRDPVEREALVFALADFAHRGEPCNLHVIEGDGVARPVFCFLLTVTPVEVDVLVVATRQERVIPVENVRAVVDA